MKRLRNANLTRSDPRSASTHPLASVSTRRLHEKPCSYDGPRAHAGGASNYSRRSRLILIKLSRVDLTLLARSRCRPPQTRLNLSKMAMQALREAGKTLRIGMIAGDGIGRQVLPVRRRPSHSRTSRHVRLICF